MSSSDRDQQAYRAATDAARRATDARPQDPVRLKAVLQRVREARAAPAPAPASWWSLAASWSLAGVAAAALLLITLRPGVDEMPQPPPAPASRWRADVVLSSGEVLAQGDAGTAAWRDLVLAPAAGIELADGARVELALGSVARVAVEGPARFDLDAARIPRVPEGTAVFSVSRRAQHDPFRVRAGDAEILVHGTLFGLRVVRGHLEALAVQEGIVELRRKGAQPEVVFLHAGEGIGALDAAQLQRAARGFTEPWWQRLGGGGTPGGGLSVSTVPAGARVRVADTEVGTSPLRVRWAAGDHAVAVELDGYETWRGSARVAPDAIATLAVALSPLAPAPADAPPATRQARKDPWRVAHEAFAARQCRRLAQVTRQLVSRSSDAEDKARASMLAAECFLRSGNKSAALERYREVEARYPTTVGAEAALFEAAKLMMELKRDRQAMQALQRYLGRYPRGRFADPASFRRCELLIGNKRMAEAQACLESYREAYPKGRRVKESLLLLATLARSQAQWARAADLYAAYLEREPEGSRAEQALFHRVVCLQKAKSPALRQAVADYLRRFPQGPHAAEVGTLLK